MATSRLLAMLLAASFLFCLEVAARPVQDDEPSPAPLVQGDDPPWLNDRDEPRLPAVAQTTPMDALVGIESSEFDRMIDGDPLAPDDDTTLKILFRIPQMGLDAVERFVAATKDVDIGMIKAAPEDYRALLFSLRGRAIKVEQLLIRPEVAERYEFTYFYRVWIRVDEQSVVEVLCRSVPTQWPLDEDIDESVRANGLFLRMVAAESMTADSSDGNSPPEDASFNVEESSPLFAANQIAWFPSKGAHTGPELNDGMYWLANRGMDISLWEPIANNDRKRLNAEDSECFYQTLATIKHFGTASVDNEQDEELVVPGLEIFKLLKEPQPNRGKRFRVNGNIRRITRVEVEQPYFSNRTGVEYYYQIDMFVKLEQNQVVTMSTSDGSKGPEFKNKYPITVCVPELPEGVEPTDDINVQVSLDAHFFKLWAYPSQYVEEFDPDIRQIGPLFIGHEIVMEETSADPTVFTVIAAIVLIVSLGGAWVGAWAIGRRDAKPIAKETHDEGDPGFLKTLEEQDRAIGPDSSTK